MSLERADRHERILGLLSSRGTLSAQQLAAELGVSRMTVFRDLRQLSARGLLRQVRGGATSPDFRSFDPGWLAKSAVNADAKRRIAQAAVAHFIDEDATVILESGSTAAAMLDLLVQTPRCRIFSNCIETLSRTQQLGFQTGYVFAVPGILKMGTRTFVGPEAVSYISGLALDLGFISATALNLAGQLQDPDPMEIPVKQAMVTAAKRTVLLLDQSKFGRTSLFPVVPLRTIDACVTDRPPEPAFAALLAQHGVETVVA